MVAPEHLSSIMSVPTATPIGLTEGPTLHTGARTWGCPLKVKAEPQPAVWVVKPRNAFRSSVQGIGGWQCLYRYSRAPASMRMSCPTVHQEDSSGEEHRSGLAPRRACG